MKKGAQFRFVRSGDLVKILTGNDKGRIGSVVSRSESHVVVQGINRKKKAVKSQEGAQKGKFEWVERPIHLSNVRICVGDKPVRLSVRFDEDGNKNLVYKNREGNWSMYRCLKKRSDELAHEETEEASQKERGESV